MLLGWYAVSSLKRLALFLDSIFGGLGAYQTFCQRQVLTERTYLLSVTLSDCGTPSSDLKSCPACCSCVPVQIDSWSASSDRFAQRDSSDITFHRLHTHTLWHVCTTRAAQSVLRNLHCDGFALKLNIRVVISRFFCKVSLAPLCLALKRSWSLLLNWSTDIVLFWSVSSIAGYTAWCSRASFNMVVTMASSVSRARLWNKDQRSDLLLYEFQSLRHSARTRSSSLASTQQLAAPTTIDIMREYDQNPTNAIHA